MFALRISMFASGIFLITIWASCDNSDRSNESVPHNTITYTNVPVGSQENLRASVNNGRKDGPSPSIPRKSNQLNDNARFLAGLKVDTASEFFEMEKNDDWKRYKSWYDVTWDRLKDRQIENMKLWKGTQMNVNDSGATVLYPFSGADILYPNILFPIAKQYIMIGLEPIGEIPDLSKIPLEFWENYFLALRKAQQDLLRFSFFRTNEMIQDFEIMELNGTLPVLLIFLARSENQIIAVNSVSIDSDGKLWSDTSVTRLNTEAHAINGVEVTFRKANAKQGSEPQRLYYFRFNLSNRSISKRKGFEKYVKKLNSVKTIIKSASYLMHNNHFSSVRKIILKTSNLIIQDDSGIPLSYFEETSNWKMEYFGSYSKPIKLFENHFQPNLKFHYNNEDSFEPISFKYGYGRHSNLMIARRIKKS